MSNNKENKDSQQIFSEDITKRLVKKILDNDNYNEIHSKKSSDFNIEYEEYNEHENDYDDYDNDYYDDYNDDYNSKKAKKKNSKQENNKKRQKNTSSAHYRKNIEMYGKEFFDEDYDDYDDSSPSLIGKVISFSIIIILTISTASLALSLISTKKQLESAKEEIKELVANKEATENKVAQESLKDELDALKDENEGLKEQLNGGNAPTNNTNNTNKTPSSNSTNNNIQNNSNNSSPSEYIVKKGDVIWNISKTVYGNGAHYQKILDANGLKESSVLQPGQKLIIPKLN